jgi:ferredoxin
MGEDRSKLVLVRFECVSSQQTQEEMPMNSSDAKRGLQVRIDPRRCIANAKCTTAAPGIYVLDEETGVAVLENEAEATVEQLFAGARVCPTQAITIEQYGRRVFPQIVTPMFGETTKDDDSTGDAGT